MPTGERTLIMGILNVTPDSSATADSSSRLMRAGPRRTDDLGRRRHHRRRRRVHAPGGEPYLVEEEINASFRIEAWPNARTPISVDTTKSEVARAALDAGAAIVNDISALRFDFYVADAVARAGAGLVLMHSRGTPATMHRLPPVADIMHEVTHSLRASINMAERRGVKRESIVIDPGIGFGKRQERTKPANSSQISINLSPAFPRLPPS
jgi:dihydropteroate synthase